ncbi:hypothetical protein ZOSMA_270G00210 [Zostera marina]|uniref:Uncharacterized protein n=1 Tax=Zostera marina TaxID=29655 RepID=A0A0K9PDW2_ZOSMR|nr:hypothetical protein ZOSMA_270G00210 [Zostera marina]
MYYLYQFPTNTSSTSISLLIFRSGRRSRSIGIREKVLHFESVLKPYTFVKLFPSSSVNKSKKESQRLRILSTIKL